MPNAIEILSTALVEYPKNPTTGTLVRLINVSGSYFGAPSAAPEDYTPDNTCLCLLGHVGVAGGAGLQALATYNALLDQNGIEEAIGFLYQAITGTHRGERFTAQLYHDIYSFNDTTLVGTSAAVGQKPEYSPESVAEVTAKIQEALELAKAAAKAAEIKATKQALVDAVAALAESEQAVLDAAKAVAALGVEA